MKLPSLYKIQRALTVGVPLLGIGGLTWFLYERGKQHGMNDLCDWVKNHGHVMVTGEDGTFAIKKEEVQNEEGESA